MRIVLLGDSHLARVRRDLPVLGQDVCNAAQGGATSLGLLGQATEAGIQEDEVVVVSVGTNDAAPWRHVPVAEFVRSLVDCMHSVVAHRWVYLAPPGVDESRLTGPGEPTNAILDQYRQAALPACDDAGARVVRADYIISPLGRAAFAEDGLHLSGRAYRLLLPSVAEAIQAAT